MDEPTWLSRLAIDALHLDQLREHGGLRGVRDDNALESALARPRQRWRYDPEADLAALAAAYGFGLVQDHPYADGNKRVGFIALATFLDLNGVILKATDADVVAMMNSLAAGTSSEEELATWIRLHA
jgi:death-on-curing family protein